MSSVWWYHKRLTSIDANTLIVSPTRVDTSLSVSQYHGVKNKQFFFMYDTLETIHISQSTCIFHIAMPIKRALKYVFLAWSSLDLIFMLLPVGHYFCFWSLNKTKYYNDIYLLFVSLSSLVITYNINNQTRHPTVKPTDEVTSINKSLVFKCHSVLSCNRKFHMH